MSAGREVGLKALARSRSPRVLFAILVAAATCATSTPTATASDWAVRMPVEFRSWNLTNSDGQTARVTQAFVPVISTVAFGPRSHLVLSTAGVSSRLRTEQTTDGLNGSSDVKAQLYRKLSRDRLLVVGGVNLPSGKTEFDSIELGIARSLNHPLLGMPAKQYGRGFAWNLGLAWTTPVTPGVRFGASCGYRSSGSYNVVEGTEEFSSAPEISASGGVSVSRKSHLSGTREAQFRATYRTYGDDELGGLVVYEQSDQLELAFETLLDNRTLELSTTTQLVFTGSSTAFADPAGVETSTTLDPGSFALLRLRLERGMSERWRLGVAGDWKHIHGSDQLARNGDTYGMGPSLSRAIGGGSWVRAQASYLIGSIGEDSSAIDVDGFALSLGLTWRAGS